MTDGPCATTATSGAVEALMERQRRHHHRRTTHCPAFGRQLDGNLDGLDGTVCRAVHRNPLNLKRLDGMDGLDGTYFFHREKYLSVDSTDPAGRSRW